MKLVLDDMLWKSSCDELKEFLLGQTGIITVTGTHEEGIATLDIKYNDKTNPTIIMGYIKLFQDNDYSSLLAFDKDYIGKTKTLKYTIDDLCCEYCYKGFVMSLFENDKIKSAKSNFDLKSVFDIEFMIEYDENYQEEALIEYIKENN